jgi:hypothetical protein
LRVFQLKGGKYEDPKKSTRRDRLGTVVAARNTYSDFAYFVPGPGLHVRTDRILRIDRGEGLDARQDSLRENVKVVCLLLLA